MAFDSWFVSSPPWGPLVALPPSTCSIPPLHTPPWHVRLAVAWSGREEHRLHGDEAEVVDGGQALVSGAVEVVPGEWGEPALRGGAVHRLSYELLCPAIISHLKGVNRKGRHREREEKSLSMQRRGRESSRWLQLRKSCLGIIASSWRGFLVLQVIATADSLTRISLRVRIIFIIWGRKKQINLHNFLFNMDSCNGCSDP